MIRAVVVAICETAAVQDTDDCRSVVVDDVTDAAFRIGRRGRNPFDPLAKPVDRRQLAKAEWVVRRARKELEDAAAAVIVHEAEAIAEELAECDRRAARLR